MPPTLKVKGKKRKGKGGKRRKGKKKKKQPAQVNPPPLHTLTELYNQLREKVFDLQRSQVTVRKKRLEGWYMTREMLNLKHDNEVYHDYLKEKMEDVERLIKEITSQLEKERAEVERLIKERMAEYDRKLAEYRQRMTKGESELNELKLKLMEFDPLIKKLAALMARLKELQDQLFPFELEANIKTRHLKNQYLNERAKLHNHLEDELFKLVTTCRLHLMPIMADHMSYMESENRCNRWELNRLDIKNFEMSQTKELLLEKRNRLNMERGYLSLDWAFNKLAQSDTKKKEKLEQSKKITETPTPEGECELSVAFKQYLNKRLLEERLRKEKNARMQKKREEKKRLLEIEQEKERRAAERAAKKSLQIEEIETDEEEWDHYEDEYEGSEDEEDEEMEYYEDEYGNFVLATSSRMKLHKSIMENKSLNEMTDDESDDYDEDEDEDEGEGSGEGSKYSSSTLSSGSSFASDDAHTINGDEEDYGQGDDDLDDNSGHGAINGNPNSGLASGMSSLKSSKSTIPISSKTKPNKPLKPLKPKVAPKKK